MAVPDTTWRKPRQWHQVTEVTSRTPAAAGTTFHWCCCTALRLSKDAAAPTMPKPGATEANPATEVATQTCRASDRGTVLDIPPQSLAVFIYFLLQNACGTCVTNSALPALMRFISPDLSSAPIVPDASWELLSLQIFPSKQTSLLAQKNLSAPSSRRVHGDAPNGVSFIFQTHRRAPRTPRPATTFGSSTR